MLFKHTVQLLVALCIATPDQTAASLVPDYTTARFAPGGKDQGRDPFISVDTKFHRPQQERAKLKAVPQAPAQAPVQAPSIQSSIQWGLLAAAVASFLTLVGSTILGYRLLELQLGYPPRDESRVLLVCGIVTAIVNAPLVVYLVYVCIRISGVVAQITYAIAVLWLLTGLASGSS